MTAFIVDTHALLWFLRDDEQLSSDARATMESRDNTLLVSAASVWEMGIKAGLGKLTVPAELPALLHNEGFESLDVSTQHAWAVRQLALGEHRDPFDRLLAAQALVEDLAVISNDARLETYGVTRHW